MKKLSTQILVFTTIAIFANSVLADRAKIPEKDGVRGIRLNMVLEDYQWIKAGDNPGSLNPEHYGMLTVKGFQFNKEGENNKADIILDHNYLQHLLPWRSGKRKQENQPGLKCQQGGTKPQDKCYTKATDLSAEFAWEGVTPKGKVGTTPLYFLQDNTNEGNTGPIPAGFYTNPISDGGFTTGSAGIISLAVPKNTKDYSLWTALDQAFSFEANTIYASYYLTTSKDGNWKDVFQGNTTGAIKENNGGDNNENNQNNQKKYYFEGSQFRASDQLKDVLDYKELEEKDGIWFDAAYTGVGGRGRWVLKNATLYLMDKNPEILFDLKEQDVCLNLNANATFLVPGEVVNQFKQKASYACCRGNTCSDSAFLLNGADINLNFGKDPQNEKQDIIIDIPAPGYMYTNAQIGNKTHPKTGIAVSVEAIEDYQNSGCASTDKLGLGRMFFFNKQVVFKLVKGTNGWTAKIGVFPYEYRPLLGQYAKVATLVAVGLGFVFSLFICIMCLRWKGMNESIDEEEEDYHHAPKETAKDDLEE